MRIIYIRTAKGMPSEAAQMAAIVAASGATEGEQRDAWVDRTSRGKAPRMDERRHMLGALREGDEVWIARAGVLGTSEADIIDYLAQLTEMGAVLCVASTGTRCRWSPDLVAALAFVKEAAADERGAALAKARAAIRRRPGNPSKEDAQWQAARVLWADPALTAREVSERTTIAIRHLYRRLGPRGTAPFTGGKKERRK